MCTTALALVDALPPTVRVSVVVSPQVSPGVTRCVMVWGMRLIERGEWCAGPLAD